jgi:SAM-dependent MidA family methyltransferase
MNIIEMLPELNENQRKYLQRTLLAITKDSREKALPIAYIEQKLEELFGCHDKP